MSARISSDMTVEGTILPFLSPEEKLKLLFRLHVTRVSITPPSNHQDSGKELVIEDDVENTYSVCIERNGKFQTTKEGKLAPATPPHDNAGDNRSNAQTYDFNETISLVRL